MKLTSVRLKEIPPMRELLYSANSTTFHMYNSWVGETVRGNVAFRFNLLIGRQLMVLIENRMVDKIRTHEIIIN